MLIPRRSRRRISEETCYLSSNVLYFQLLTTQIIYLKCLMMDNWESKRSSRDMETTLRRRKAIWTVLHPWTAETPRYVVLPRVWR